MVSHPLLCLVWLCLIPQEAVTPTTGSALTAFNRPAADSISSAESLSPASAVPVLPLLPKTEDTSIEWSAVGRSSLRFLGIMHIFRWATESDTRAGGIGWGAGYRRSVTNMHGWADGDPFYTNYLGHPAQGAISGRLLLNHDPRYRSVEFGRNPDYWKGKLRASAFAFGFSEQFELGLLSEASIGQIQGRFPQQGFVDHVITPTVGMGLMVAEDAADRYIVKPLEGRFHNQWARIALRTGLNPTRSFANLMDGRLPWRRFDRPGVTAYRPEADVDLPVPASNEVRPALAPLEFSVASGYRQFPGSSCIGGGAEAAYRVASDWQLLLDVNGCNLFGLPRNVSGDALIYQVGSRWSPDPATRWAPYVQVLIGGIKVTQERLYPDKKAAIELAYPNAGSDPDLAHMLHDRYTSNDAADGLAVSAGTGVDYKLNDALAIRVAGLEYSRSTVGTLGGMNFSSNFQFTTGMILRLGTW